MVLRLFDLIEKVLRRGALFKFRFGPARLRNESFGWLTKIYLEPCNVCNGSLVRSLDVGSINKYHTHQQ